MWYKLNQPKKPEFIPNSNLYFYLKNTVYYITLLEINVAIKIRSVILSEK